MIEALVGAAAAVVAILVATTHRCSICRRPIWIGQRIRWFVAPQATVYWHPSCKAELLRGETFDPFALDGEQ